MNKNIFSTSTFLIICILVTASAVCSVLNSVVDVFAVLTAISLWIIYSSSKSESNIEGIRFLGGILKAVYIVNWVIVGIIAVIGILIMLIPTSWLNSAIYFSNIDSFFTTKLPNISSIIGLVASTAIVWIGLFLLLISAIITVINILFSRKFFKLIYSINESIIHNSIELIFCKSVSKWLMVLGIIISLGILNITNNSYSALYSGCLGATLILSSVGIKDNLLPLEENSKSQYQNNEWYRQK